MCPNKVFFRRYFDWQHFSLRMAIGDISDLKWRPTKIVTLLRRPYRGEYLTLHWLESSENISNGISMQENRVWSRFCACRGTTVIELALRGVG